MSLVHGVPTAILIKFNTAAGAYSIRRLGIYDGPLLRVRRSSDNTEQDIGFSRTVNGLDEEALLSFCGANSGYVTTWYDQSGNAKHAAQASQAAQPRIVNAGVVDKKNSKPTLVFSGAQDLAAASTVFGTTFTVFKRAGVNNVISELTGAVGRGLIPGTGGGAVYWTHDNYAINGGTLVASQPLSAIGDSMYQVTGTGYKHTSSHRIGYGSPSWEPITGSLSELIIFSDDQTANRSYIEQNQMCYYGIVG